MFHEAMYTCTCTVGKTFGKCDNSLHAQALDYRAAAFEALKELDRARKDAEWILELAPCLPDVRSSVVNGPPQILIFSGLFTARENCPTAEEE